MPIQTTDIDNHNALMNYTNVLPASPFTYSTHDCAPNAPDLTSVPYGGQDRMQLTIVSGAANTRLRIEPSATELITLHSHGVQTRLRVSSTELRVSWPMTFSTWVREALRAADRDVEIVLHPAVEWTVLVRGGLSHFDANLVAGKLARLDVSGGVSNAVFDLPAPISTVPVRVSGGVSELTLRRPAETGVSLAIGGGVSTLHLDEQQFGSIGGSSRLVSGVTDSATPRYAVEISGGASAICVTSH